jgi:hypothetical protein
MISSKVDSVASDRHLWANPIAEIEQASTKIALELRLAEFLHLFWPDHVGLHRVPEVLDERQLQIAGSQIACSYGTDEHHPVTGTRGGNV